MSEHFRFQFSAWIQFFPLWTFHFYVATFQQHLHLEYMSLSWSGISELVISIMISFIEGCYWHGSYWTKDSQCLRWNHHLERFTVATMTWLTVTEYLCHKWPHICSVCRNQNPVLSSFMTYHICVKRVTRWDSHVEREMLPFLEKLNSPTLCVGFMLLDLSM